MYIQNVCTKCIDKMYIQNIYTKCIYKMYRQNVYTIVYTNACTIMHMLLGRGQAIGVPRSISAQGNILHAPTDWPSGCTNLPSRRTDCPSGRSD